MRIVVRPLAPERWHDLEAVFRAKGCSIARGCWCMYYRRSGAPKTVPPGESRSEQNRLDLQARAAEDPPPGLIGYEGKVPVGWISLGPRQDFARLEKSPVMKPIDDQTVWSIICFVVPSEYRRRGVAKKLLSAAIAYARKRGVRLLEAYPVDRAKDSTAESLWFGTKTMFDEAGFNEVARRKPSRPIVRLRLSR